MKRVLGFRSKGNGKQTVATSSTVLSPAEAPTNPPPAPTAGAIRYGLQIVHEGTDPIMDIVAVHGLNGHYEKTWTAGNGVHWLRDLLPQDLPQARILSWGYDANTVSCQYLYDHARTLVSDLCLERQLTESSKRPIIFVAHSLGGIIVKSALIHSSLARQGAVEEHRAVKLSTYGIIFMGTPHQGGSGVAFGRRLVNVASVFVASDNRLLQHLEQQSEWLQQQLGQYAPISNDFVTKFAYEVYPTPTVLGMSIDVVPKWSALVPGAADSEAIAIYADHINMVKFEAKSDAGYKTVSGHLRLMARKAADEVGRTWETEGKVDAVRLDKDVAPFKVQFTVPEVAYVERLVGREEEHDFIHKELQYDGSRKTVVVHGLGGMGKTQLVLDYARRHRDEYSAVFWVNCKSEDTLRQSYAAAVDRVHWEHPSLERLKTMVESGNLDKMGDALKRWLDITKNDRWLLIFDNHDTPKLPGHEEAGAFDIRSFLPRAYHGAVLITTRSSQLDIGRRVAVKKLQDIEHSLEIMSQTSRRNGLHSDPDARKLAEKLDGLPLALATAGAYLHQVSTSFAEYLQMYDASWLRLQQMTPQLLSYEDRALYSTWNISLENVKQRSEVAAKLLQLWAYFDNQDMSWELLWTGRGGSPEWFLQLTKDQLSFDAAIRVLCDHALVEADAAIRIGGVEHRGCSMHSCVHAWTNHVANPRFNEDLAKLALICVAFHASSAMRVANERGDGEVVRLDWTLVEKYASSVDTESRWVMELRVLRHADRCRNFIADVLGRQDDDLFITTALQNLGSVYRHQRKLDEAEEMFQRALECEEKALGPDNISTLNSALKVGILNEERGNLQKAENMYMRALKGFEKTLGPDNEATFDTISHLASIYGSKGKLDKEEEMYKRALKGKEKVLGHDDISTITTVINMATFYHRQGQLDQAGKMYRRASDAFKDKQKRDRHVELYLFIQFNIARFFGEQGQISGATRLLKSLHDIAQGKLGPNHELTSHVVSKLGSLYVHQGRLDEAEQMYNSVLGIQERVLGSDHTSTLETTRCLGNVYERQSKVDRAEEMYNRVLKGDNGAFRLDRKVALDTVNNLGEFYRHQHKLNEAEELYKQVLNDYKNLFELDRESVLTTVNNLGTIYIYQERFDEAEAMLKLALKGREEAHGSDHELTLHSVHNLGSLYIAWHKPDNMEVVLERALKGRIGVLGPNHASTIETVNNLDVFYTRQGRPDEARLMYERALKECSDPDRVRTGR